eukprot:3642826-Heterocapsa_arctica.AAC.1
MTGSHQRVNQRGGRFVVPSLEQPPVIDVCAQLCRLRSFVARGHLPVILGVARVGFGSLALILVAGYPVGRGLQAL